MLQIFSENEKYFNDEMYQDLDVRRFYDDVFNNPSIDELYQRVK
jgi:hypothetical protein